MSFNRILFFLFKLTMLLIIAACGNEMELQSGSNNETGAYSFRLTFPSDVPKSNLSINAGLETPSGKIKCDDIDHIKCWLFNEKHKPIDKKEWPCRDHGGSISSLRPASNLTAVITAEDKDGTVLFQGEESNIKIEKGKVTKGKEIVMTPPQSFFIEDFNMEFVRIPSGTFNMGSLEELGRLPDEIQHRVEITRDYYMQTTEVTQGQYAAIMDTNPSEFFICGEECPVENVSWEEAMDLINKLNTYFDGEYEFTLPTEAQWEYAARAGGKEAFANGGISATGCEFDQYLNEIGWYCNNAARDMPEMVGKKIANAYDLLDMHGNVKEWCKDWYDAYSSDPQIDPTGPSFSPYHTRVTRGGGWRSHVEECRSASRDEHEPTTGNNNIGFRLVCLPKKPVDWPEALP